MIKIRLTRTQYMELMQLYNACAFIWRASDDPHKLLLSGHMQQLQAVIYRELQAQEQKKFMLKLRPADALAFYQTWQLIDTSPWPLGTVVIAHCIKEIDLTVKNSRVYANS